MCWFRVSPSCSLGPSRPVVSPAGLPLPHPTPNPRSNAKAKPNRGIERRSDPHEDGDRDLPLTHEEQSNKKKKCYFAVS